MHKAGLKLHTALAVVHTHKKTALVWHTALAVMRAQNRTYLAHCAGSSVHMQCGIYTHDTLRWQWYKHNTGHTQHTALA